MSTLMFFVHIALMCVYLEVVRVGWVFQLGFGGCGLDLEAFGVFCGVDVGFGDDFHEVEEDDEFFVVFGYAEDGLVVVGYEGVLVVVYVAFLEGEDFHD